jgi:single-stranded DNA-specific DHH superfamily exonuclease
MNRVYDLLEKKGLVGVVQGVHFKKIIPKGAKSFLSLIKCIKENNLYCYVDPDCDPDGYFLGLEFKRMFDILDFHNYDIGHHIYKRHGINEAYAYNLIQKHYEVVFLLDSSTNDMGVIRILCNHDITVCIIDHHETEYEFSDYPNNCLIINPRIECHSGKVLYSELSAGAIGSLLCDYVLSTYIKHVDNVEFYIYGYITLYSDACNMSNLYNVAFIKEYRGRVLDLPEIVKLFMNKQSSFNRNFVSFRMIPRINALIREEYFDLVWDLFYDIEKYSGSYGNLINSIDIIYHNSKEYVSSLVLNCTIKEYDKFVVATLPLNVERKARNYTGLVANGIGEPKNKTTLCLMQMNADRFEGSVRDPFSRDILTLMKTLCYAEGHPPAFGISIPRQEIDTVINSLNSLSDFFALQDDNIMMLDMDAYPNITRSDLHSEVMTMAEYNEYGGQGLPSAFMLKRLCKGMILNKYKSNSTVSWLGERIVVFNTTVNYGDVLILSPTLGVQGAELLTQKVGFSSSVAIN